MYLIVKLLESNKCMTQYINEVWYNYVFVFLLLVFVINENNTIPNNINNKTLIRGFKEACTC